MQKYELTVVLDGKITPAKRKAFVLTLEKIVEVLKGKVAKMDEWGEKDLAYKIEKSLSGFYLYFLLELDNSSVKALNLKLKMEKDLLRHLLVKEE